MFSETFKEYVSPCKSQNWLEIWPKEQVENLETLGNKKNKKIMLGFTNIENNYFVAELTMKSSSKILLYLFKKNEEKPTLIKIEISSKK